MKKSKIITGLIATICVVTGIATLFYVNQEDSKDLSAALYFFDKTKGTEEMMFSDNDFLVDFDYEPENDERMLSVFSGLGDLTDAWALQMNVEGIEGSAPISKENLIKILCLKDPTKAIAPVNFSSLPKHEFTASLENKNIVLKLDSDLDGNLEGKADLKLIVKDLGLVTKIDNFIENNYCGIYNVPNYSLEVDSTNGGGIKGLFVNARLESGNIAKAYLDKNDLKTMMCNNGSPKTAYSEQGKIENLRFKDNNDNEIGPVFTATMSMESANDNRPDRETPVKYTLEIENLAGHDLTLAGKEPFQRYRDMLDDMCEEKVQEEPAPSNNPFEPVPTERCYKISDCVGGGGYWCKDTCKKHRCDTYATCGNGMRLIQHDMKEKCGSDISLPTYGCEKI